MACGFVLSPGPACARVEGPGSSPTDAGAVREQSCEQQLKDRGVVFQSLAAPDLVKTPIEVTGPIGPLLLIPRGRRPAIMDCTLARALFDAAPVFTELGVARLTFSAAYDHRTRRDSLRLSSHALGLAIDVHTLEGPAGELDVLRDFEKGVGRWRDLERGAGALTACIGAPVTARGRTLRTLACRLKLETSFRIVVTPDDNDDHKGHLHLEHAPTGSSGVLDELPPGPTPPAAAVKAKTVVKAKAKTKAKTKAKVKSTSKRRPAATPRAKLGHTIKRGAIPK